MALREAGSALDRVEREFADAVRKFDNFMGTKPGEKGVIDQVRAVIKEYGDNPKRRQEMETSMREIRRTIVERALEIDANKGHVPQPGLIHPFSRKRQVREGLQKDLDGLRGDTYRGLIARHGDQEALKSVLEIDRAYYVLFGKKFDQSGNMTFIWAVFDAPEGRKWVRGELKKNKQAAAERAAQPPQPERRPEPRREAPTVPEKPPGARAQGGMDIRAFRKKMAQKGSRVKGEGEE